MISLTIKFMNGDMLGVEYDPRSTRDQLYNIVWIALPNDIRPKSICQMMLFRSEEDEWIRPVSFPVRPEKHISPFEDGEVLNIFFDTTLCILYTEELWERNNVGYFRISIHDSYEHIYDREPNYSEIIYMSYDSKAFYFEDEVELKEEYINFLGNGHDDFMDLLNKVDISPCSKEYLYFQLFDIFLDKLPQDDRLIPDCPIYNTDIPWRDNDYNYE